MADHDETIVQVLEKHFLEKEPLPPEIKEEMDALNLISEGQPLENYKLLEWLDRTKESSPELYNKFIKMTTEHQQALAALEVEYVKMVEKLKQDHLPPLKSDASGCECSKEDGIDREDRDFMRGRVQGIIESGEIDEKGWLVRTSAYEINMGVVGTALAGHNNLEIIKPDETIFATLDTQQINREDGAVKGYFPDGEYAAPVLDECIPGNKVVLDKNLGSGEILYVGSGPEAVLRFAKAAEVAVHFSKQNMNYKVLPDEGQNEANSNSYGRAFAEAAAGFDPINKMAKYADEIGLAGSPGLHVDLIKEPLKSRYNGMSGEEFINNPEMIEKFCDDLKDLHPISQQLRAIEFGKNEAVSEAAATQMKP